MFIPARVAAQLAAPSDSGGGSSAPQSPWVLPTPPPKIASLAYGEVTAALGFRAPLSVGTLRNVGLAPGYELKLTVTTGTAVGACGSACDITLASAVRLDDKLTVTEPNGLQRKFSTTAGGSLREDGPPPSEPCATASIIDGSVVITEPDTVKRTFESGRETIRETPFGALRWRFDVNGRLTEVANALDEKLSVTYDAQGRVATVTDPKGFTVAMSYLEDGGSGHLLRMQGPPDSATTGLAPNVTFGWAANDLVTVTRQGFAPMRLRYQGGKVIGADDVDGRAYAFAGTATTLAVVDSEGQRTKLQVDATSHEVARVERGDGTATNFVRDAKGRVLESRMETPVGVQVTQYTRDENGRILMVTQPDGKSFSFTYDSAGRITATRDTAGRTEQMTYDQAGRPTRIVDALGRVSTVSYDARGLVTAVNRAGVTSAYAYNERGQVVSATDPWGKVTTVAYDERGRPTRVAKADATPMLISYTETAGGTTVERAMGSLVQRESRDAYGRVYESTMPYGETERSTFDALSGLPDRITRTFGSTIHEEAYSYTAAGAVQTYAIDGVMRQSQARVVPPGVAFNTLFGGSGTAPSTTSAGPGINNAGAL